MPKLEPKHINFKDFLKIKNKKLISSVLTFIPHLKNIYLESPMTIDKVLNTPVVIAEKQDGMKFSIVKTIDERVEYWSKNMKLDIISRTINKDWDVLIDRLEELRKRTDNFKKLPKGSEIAGEFFGNSLENIVDYTHPPRGNYVVYFANISSKIYTTLQYKELWKWADYLESERQPVIYDGKFTEEAKNAIMSFIQMTDEGRLQIFKNGNFDVFLENLMGTLPNSKFRKGAKEGIVLYSRVPELPLSKIIDPEFTAKNRMKWDSFKEALTEFRKELIAQTVKRMSDEVLYTYKETYSIDLEMLETPEERVLLILSKMFVKLLSKDHVIESIFKKYKKLKNKGPFSEINDKYLAHTPRLYGLLNDWFLKEYFTVVLTTFRNKQKSRRGYLKGIDLDRVNEIIKILKEID